MAKKNTKTYTNNIFHIFILKSSEYQIFSKELCPSPGNDEKG